MRKEVRPRVEAICMGGLEGVAHQTVCRAVAESLGKYQPIAGYGMVAPFCEKVCWHSCNGESHAGGQDDGFTECPSVGCAQDSCLDFLLRECPPVTHPDIQNLYDTKCALAPPSPPRPPYPPPPPYGFAKAAPRPPATATARALLPTTRERCGERLRPRLRDSLLRHVPRHRLRLRRGARHGRRSARLLRALRGHLG